MNIQTFDLNLLRVLDALLRERNVSRAAERLALSQPAVSNALNRLRELLDDPLLVRAGRAMQPTPRALALEAPIRAALRQIEQSLGDGEGFDPGRSRQRFTVAVTDYVELICMPALMRRLSERAPGISIAIQHLTPTLPAEALDKGELDLVLGRFENVPARFQRRHWASETLQLVARRNRSTDKIMVLGEEAIFTTQSRDPLAPLSEAQTLLTVHWYLRNHTLYRAVRTSVDGRKDQPAQAMLEHVESFLLESNSGESQELPLSVTLHLKTQQYGALQRRFALPEQLAREESPAQTQAGNNNHE